MHVLISGHKRHIGAVAAPMLLAERHELVELDYLARIG
jgi:hypothetical protein